MRKSSTIPQRITITKLLLCFDLSERIIENIAAGFQGTALKIEEGPFVLHDILVEIIFIEYEKALWAFQQPVRWYEKVRIIGPNYSAKCSCTYSMFTESI
jgi:hypothetical protein